LNVPKYAKSIYSNTLSQVQLEEQDEKDNKQQQRPLTTQNGTAIYPKYLQEESYYKW
jgi:hypothetical protein